MHEKRVEIGCVPTLYTLSSDNLEQAHKPRKTVKTKDPRHAWTLKLRVYGADVECATKILLCKILYMKN